MTLRAVWEDEVVRPAWPTLDRDLQVDAVVVGAGITGLTTAWLLTRAGYRVAVLEAGRVAGGATGASSAHLTVAIDGGYRALESRLGEDGCRHVFHAGNDAIELIEQLSGELGIDGFARVDGFHFSDRASDVDRLREEEDVLRRLGARAELVLEAPLPWENLGGYRIEGQAMLQPVAYALGLAAAITRGGGRIFEHSRVVSWSGTAPVRVRANGRDVETTFLAVTTHVPVGRHPSVQARVVPKTTYVLAYELSRPLSPGLFWDADDPYHYVRPLSPARTDVAIVGGADHATGREPDTRARFAQLDRWARDRLAVTREVSRWSDEVFEPADGVPYVGPLPLAPHVLVASGFAGQGLTLGTAAARTLVDHVRGEPARYGGVFDVGRLAPRASARTAARIGLDTVVRMVGDRVRSVPSGDAIARLAPGEGAILRTAEGRSAVYKQPDGAVTVLSPVCSHAGCHVAWNGAASTWDCPCHGGRYTAEGHVLAGPPLSGLTVLRTEAPPPPARPTPSADEREPELA